MLQVQLEAGILVVRQEAYGGPLVWLWREDGVVLRHSEQSKWVEGGWTEKRKEGAGNVKGE